MVLPSLDHNLDPRGPIPASLHDEHRDIQPASQVSEPVAEPLKTDAINDISQDGVSPAIPTHSTQNVSAIRTTRTGVNAPSLEAMQSPFFYDSCQHGHFTPRPSGQGWLTLVMPSVISALSHLNPVKSGQTTTVDDVDRSDAVFERSPSVHTAHLIEHGSRSRMHADLGEVTDSATALNDALPRAEVHAPRDGLLIQHLESDINEFCTEVYLRSERAN
jgi:hypothetical protein